MRADAHYVDQLVAPARRGLEDEARPAPAKPQPASKTAVDVPVLNEDALVHSLRAVLSCTDLLGDGMPHLTKAVAVDMIRAEAQRAISALRTAHVLKHGVPAERRLVDPRSVVAQVVGTVNSEARLRGCRVSSSVEVPDSLRLRVDEGTLVTTLSSVALMLIAGLHDLQGARLELKVSGGDANRVVFSIAQESVIVPDAFLKMVNTAGEPGTPQTAPLLALRHIAEGYGGSAVATRLPHGTQIAVELPTAD